MRRRAIIGALLLIGAGVVLGTTVFRTDIAQATGLAQSVTVVNTAANPVPVREQNVDAHGNINVHEEGLAHVSVLNTVATTNTIPLSAFSFVAEQNPVVSGPDAAGISYAITSLTFTNDSNFIEADGLGGEYGTPASGCNFVQPTIVDGPIVRIPPHSTLHLDFPQPFVISGQSGTASCLVHGAADFLTVVGYRF